MEKDSFSTDIHLGALHFATKPVFSHGAILRWAVNVFPDPVIAEYIRCLTPSTLN